MTGSLTSEQVDQFHREGFLVLPGVLDPAKDLAPVITEYEGILDGLATQLHASGDIADPYADLPFSERLTTISAETGKDLTQHFDFSLPQKATRADTPIWNGPGVFSLLRHEGVLDAVESLIGPEIYANPVQHVRLKPPEQRIVDADGVEPDKSTPWHQDNAVVTADADETETITVWLPLGPATAENGCLEVEPGLHHGPILPHCPQASPVGLREGGSPGLRIPSAHLDHPRVTLEMAAGDVLLMHRRTPHHSLRNRSDSVRWSFDLRFQPTGQPSGRSVFPGFVARSVADPDTELRDADEWARLWLEARDRVSRHKPSDFNRWKVDDEMCA
ncbi:phytanoyl-CoA dioxygenase family protein [Propionibacteriaceae bacterium Y1685]|uniref:phytanoyl-CoA dioxygenase family protein n=1 Tax=Microlunatus sp. Y1700 TaxID=3418487 RepID=UPI003B79B2B4